MKIQIGDAFLFLFEDAKHWVEIANKGYSFSNFTERNIGSEKYNPVKKEALRSKLLRELFAK